MKNKVRGWETISSKKVYQNPWIRVFEDKVIRPDGKQGIYGYLDKDPGVFILVQKGKQFCLIRNYRYPAKREFWELPGGVAKVKDDADIAQFEQEAIRELAEEIGVHKKHLERLGRVYLGVGHETTFVEIFTTELSKDEVPNVLNQEGDESIVGVQFINKKEVIKMLENGQLVDSILLASLAMWLSRNWSDKI